jgi:two-component system, cell cycle sensor histidine kinase and response regulator CckA
MGVPLRVMMIEDSDDDAKMILRELKRANYAVDFERVASADALKALIASRAWDLFISDFSMPRFSGTDALRFVRSTGCDTPFIFVSGTMGEDTAVAALKDGAQDYIIKNNLKRLVPAVQRELREAQERRERKRLEQHVSQLQKFEAIGRLAGGVAHDFNNLLSVILGQTEILLDRAQDEGMNRGLEMIRESARRGANLTRQLLAFGRRQVLEPRVVNLNAVLLDIEKLLRRLIGENIELDFQTDAGLGNVKADPSQLEQIVINLATNARDAMTAGGKLTIATANADLGEAYADRRIVDRPGRYTQLTISDTGCGMDLETQSHIFEPFFTTKERGKGTGLGLATVYGIVKQSGGNISVHSEPDRGTVFKIYLPLVEATSEGPECIERGNESPRGSETVLVVEDDASLREITGQFLQSSGYTVVSAGSPEEALDLVGCHKGPIDFLLTDVMLPKMNGRELATRLSKIRPGIKVLYVSGYTDGIMWDGVHGTLEEGLEFLQKPYTRDALILKIREVLDAGQFKLEDTKR